MTMRVQSYLDPRPAEYFERFHLRARTRGPDWVYDLARVACTLYALALCHARCNASENVPASGPVILAPNHFSALDHLFVGMFIRRRVRFMAKSQLFRPPLEGLFAHLGVFPVRRGHGDDEAMLTAQAILAAGGCVAIYCEGGRSRNGVLAEHPRPGVGRLALLSGAPVVPIAIHGSERARDWRRVRLARVRLRFGDPLRFEPCVSPSRVEQQQAAEVVFAAIKELHTRGG